MMKQEFENLIGAEICAEDYAIIEYVYTWHPSIPNVGGKQKIAELLKIGGMGLIRSMQDKAKWAESIVTQIDNKQSIVSKLKLEIADLQAQLDKYA